MIYQIFSNKDATIYEGTSSLNTGLDQILELEHHVKSGSINSVSRILTQFDLTDVSASIVDGTITNPKFYLVLSAVEGTEIPIDYTLDVHAVSQSWDMGFGRKFNFPITTTDVTWVNRTDTSEWLTSSFAPNSTGASQLTDGGGTWYINSTASYGAPITITSINKNDNFYVTSSAGTIYTFSMSGSTETSSSFVNVNKATGSIEITNISQNDTFIVSASLSASFVNVDNPFLFNDITASNVYYFSGDGTLLGTPSNISYLSEGISEGDQFIISDGSIYTFIAADLPVPADVPTSNVYYFPMSESAVNSAIASMSIEINNVTSLNVTSSFSGSILQLSSSIPGVVGNEYTFNTVAFSGGTDGEVQALSDKINSIDGIEYSLVTSASIISLTASLAGTDANTYTFTSGSTVTTLSGGTILTTISSSFTLATDNTTSNLYYFITGSTLSDSVSVLTNKIDEVTTFINVTSSDDILYITGSGHANDQLQVGFQSGSTNTLLTVPVEKYELIGSERFNFTDPDTRIDVSNIVNDWIYGNIKNDGFIIKRPDTAEGNGTSLGNIKFFSQDTHTIYIPKLQVAWDNHEFNTGNLSALDAESKVLYVSGLKKRIKTDSKVRMRVRGRSKYPQRTFATSSAYLDINYLPETTYYAVKDTVTEDYIIPFDDNYTILSCDEEGNYLDLWTAGFLPERYYKLVFKVISADGTEEYFDDSNYFKVVR